MCNIYFVPVYAGINYANIKKEKFTKGVIYFYHFKALQFIGVLFSG